MAAASKGLKVVMFLGSVRENRMCQRVSLFMKKELEARSHEVHVLDPLEIDAPLMVKPLHHYQDKAQAPTWLRETGEKVKAADCYVIVSAEYNHSIPPALSNLLDYFPGSSYGYKPSGIVCYSMGPYGGVRAAMQLRCMLAELGTLSVSNCFAIPTVQNNFTEGGEPQSARMKSGAARMLGQLEWMAHAMKNHRAVADTPQ